MPSPIVAIDLLKTAMRLKGIIATGETPSAEKTADALRALNDVLETWSIEPYAVWGALAETFVTAAGQSTYTFGPGGDWQTDRPIAIGGAYVTYQGTDFPVQPWTLAEYMGEPVKQNSQPIPERIVFINDAPLARVILFPTPSQAVGITIDTPRILAQVPSAATTLQLPPAYARALQYAVAEELGPQYGSPIDLSAAARSSLALIKRMNRQSPIATFDPALLSNGGSFGGGRAWGAGAAPDQWSDAQW